MQKELQEIGLTEQESKVYLQLLKERHQEASRIAKETGINRSVVYSVLQGLIDKGLASYVIRNNVKYFMAADPKILKDYLKDKEQILKEILPKLSKIKDNEKEDVDVELYQGKKGAVTILKDILRTAKDYASIGEDGSWEREQPLMLKQYILQINKKKIRERILAKEGTKITTGKYSEVRYLPKEFEMPTITTVYGNKVVIAIFTKPYYCVLIKSKDLANSYKSFFEVLWRISKE